MKKTISVILSLCFVLTAFSALLAVPLVAFNPFAEQDRERQRSLESALSESVAETAADRLERDGGCVVKFKAEASFEEIYDCVKGYNYKLLADSGKRLFHIDGTASALLRAYPELIEEAEDDRTLTLSAAANDPLASSQWELESLDVYRAWDVTRGVRSVTVAILDSGVYRAHPDFENVSILAGYDAVTDTEGVSDDVNGHGTKIASIIAAAADNGTGMAGLASNVTLLPIRVSSSTGYIHSSDFIEAVYYAADAGVDVINMSFGGYTYSSMEEEAVQYADARGCVLISAAGNNENIAQYAGTKAYPASYNGVISVGAIDKNGELCGFSQRNDAVDLVAPGANITVANSAGGYETESGTSFASAYVAAIAALCLSAIDDGVGFNSEQFLSLAARLNGGTPTDGFGYGPINAYDMVRNINLPLVAGVTDGGVYHRNVTVTFNRGDATLDGGDFKSGDSVITSGSHRLVVTDGRNSVTIDFVTDNIPLKYEYSCGTTSAAITFTRGTATLDGVPYLSGDPITSQGRHYFKLTGPYGNTVSYEFECSFKAPEIFGVENGAVYLEPVHISAGAGGILTLNGAVIPADKVVSRNGIYTLVSSTADGKDKKTVYFTVSIPDAASYDTTVAAPKLIADDKYGVVVLYNSVLSGVRVLDVNSLSRTKCFVRTQSAVTGHYLYGEKLVLLHESGISVCDRAALAAGTVTSVLYYGFEKTADCAAAMGDFVYYVCADGTQSRLYRMDVKTGKNALVTSFGGGADFLASDGASLAAASKNGSIYLFDGDGVQKLRINAGEGISSIAVCDGYICTNKRVYGANGEALFSLRDGESVIFAKNGVLVTDGTVYDILGRRAAARFADRLSDAVYTDSGYAFKATREMTIEVVDGKGEKLTAENAARLLNAAPEKAPVFGKPQSFSVHESYAEVPDGFDVSDAVIPAGSADVFAVSASLHRLYVVDGETLSLKSCTDLRFKPSSVCSDGRKVYVSFSDESCIYVCPVSGGMGEYLNCGYKYKKILCSGANLYGLTDGGDLYSFASDSPQRPQSVIKSQNIISFACSDGFIYAYLKPAAIPMLYKISENGFSVDKTAQVPDGGEKLFAGNGHVFLGKSAYFDGSLARAYTLGSDAAYADGKYVLTADGLFSASGGRLIGDIKVDLSLPLFDDGYNYFTFEKGRICRISNSRRDLDSLPAIGGINGGNTIEGSVSATFPFGYGYLDGNPYESGALIENGGMHRFVVSLPFGVLATVDFTIEAQINAISLTAEKLIISVNETTRLQVTAHPYTYGVVEVNYTTDNENAIVLSDGSVIGAAEGVCVVTATTADGAHSASVTITVTKGLLKFDSSYFYADSVRRIVRGIPPGTGIDTLFAAVYETFGDVSIRGYNGVEVNAGTIHTGMKAELYDFFGNVVDSWLLSVTGDVDGDGYITANDCYELKKLLADPESAEASIYAAADVDGNYAVNPFDLLALKEHLLGTPLADAEPTRPASAVINVLAPETLAPETSFTVGLTLTEMKSVTAVSGVLKFDGSMLTPESVQVYGANVGGAYSVAEDGIYFFTSCIDEASTGVLLTAEFTVTAKPGETIELACSDLVLYDGSAAVAAGDYALASVVSEPETDVKILELPDYDFDREVTEYRCVFPAETSSIHVTAYPKDKCDIAGSTDFGKDNTTSFAVVVLEENGVVQYNYECEREEGRQFAPPGTNIFKNGNSSLAELTVTGGTLSPQFEKAINIYYVVCDDPSAVTVDAKAENENANVTVSDFDAETGTVRVVCTAEDGSFTAYLLHLCSELPVNYVKDGENRAWLWLFALPGALLAVLAGLFTARGIAKRKARRLRQKESGGKSKS